MSRAHLTDALQRVSGELKNLPPRPAGSPAALDEYAKALQLEHETLAHAAKSQRQVPDGLDFEGPAADRFRENAVAAGTEIGRLADNVASVAANVRGAARRLHDDQTHWDRQRTGLLDKLHTIEHQLRNAR
jgi:uncharacterized protein YukE